MGINTNFCNIYFFGRPSGYLRKTPGTATILKTSKNQGARQTYNFADYCAPSIELCRKSFLCMGRTKLRIDFEGSALSRKLQPETQGTVKFTTLERSSECFSIDPKTEHPDAPVRFLLAMRMVLRYAAGWLDGRVSIPTIS